MSESLAVLRERARIHQAEIDRARRFLTPQEMATRWGISVSTLKLIPRAELPFMEFGNGLKLRRRRYDLVDVERYEQTHKVGAAA